MQFIEVRRWIGKLTTVAIVFQMTLAMIVPTVTARIELLVIEVAILSAVLGIDIAMNVNSQLKTVQQLIETLTEQGKDE